MANRTTRGRQKIEMKKVEDEAYRLVSFSKRRSGIYKKATELSILCGAEVVIMVFSPSGKPYSYATSSMHNVIDWFLNRTLPPSNETTQILEARRLLRIDELSNNYNALVARHEAVKNQIAALKRRQSTRQVKGWWEGDIDELNLAELEQMEKWNDEFQNEIRHHLNVLNTGGGFAPLAFPSSFAPNPSPQMNHQGVPRGFGHGNEFP